MPSEDYLEAERVVLRRFTGDDAHLLFELDSDPAVRKYLDMPKPPTLADSEVTLKRLMEWYDKGDQYGFWAACSLARTGEPFMGWFHLRPAHNAPHDIELGYRLKPEFWGRGYATEVGSALVAKALAEYEVPRVIAITLAENLASRRVMEKIGMHLETEFLYDGRLKAVTYAIERPTLR